MLTIFSLTNVFFRNQEALFTPGKSIAINEGGTASSKTYSILQLLIEVCENRTNPLVVSVVSESMPHLKAGCIRDFKNIMGESFDERKWNATDNIYQFSQNVLMEFFSADHTGKASGPRRDILYCNEVNHIPKPIVDQLDLRTRRFTFYDFNPTSEFWAHEMKDLPEVAWIHSTYKDALNVLTPDVIKKIEAKKDRDPNGWRVYGLGLIGRLEGLVHPEFTMVDELPDAGSIFYGMDFGFTNDPTVLIKCVLHDDNLYCDELICETGLTNQQIAHRMESLGVKKGYDEIFADAAEPKSIEEIYQAGFNIKAAPKGADSVLHGIQMINNYKQFWTKRSLNAHKEQRNYSYVIDKFGKPTNKPMDDYNHCMDARRYGVVGKQDEAPLPGLIVCQRR
jgi:phage terminase large subunit